MAFSFGAPPKPLFGAAPATPSLFGSQPAAPSLFGTPAPAASPVGLFGAKPAAPSLFGGGLFGQTAPATPPAGGLFGQPAPTAGLFGLPAPAGGLFGQSPAAPSQFGQPAPSLFGQPAASPFGVSQPPAPAAPAPLFGQSQSAASASLFGPKPAAPSLFASQPSQFAQPAPPLPKLGDPYPPPSPYAESIESRIEKLKNAWDLGSPDCRFQTYFYNLVVEPNVVGQYGRPPGGTDERAWTRAVRENPDPDKLVPALAVGFPAVEKRIQAQTRQNAAHAASLLEISNHIASLSNTHTSSTSLRTLRASQTAATLSARLLELIAKVSKLSPTRNGSIKVEEEELRMALEGMTRAVDEGKGRMGELWRGVGELKSRVNGSGRGMGWGVADEEGLRQILEILSTQQAGLDHLTKTLSTASQDVEVMKEAFGLNLKKAHRSPPAGPGPMRD